MAAASDKNGRKPAPGKTARKTAEQLGMPTRWLHNLKFAASVLVVSVTSTTFSLYVMRPSPSSAPAPAREEVDCEAEGTCSSADEAEDECAKMKKAKLCIEKPFFMFRECPQTCEEQSLNAPALGRHLIEDAIPQNAIATLLELATTATMLGDGYNGMERPFKSSDFWAGVQPEDAANWAMEQPEEDGRRAKAVAWARTLVEVVRRMRELLEERFLLGDKSSIDFAQLACRSHVGDHEDNFDSHPAHADNCQRVGDECQFGRESAHWRTHAGTLYLHGPEGGEFSGGDFFYTPSWDSPRSDRARLTPRAGRMTAFEAGASNIHGVEAVRSGTRCHLSVWLVGNSDKANGVGWQAYSLQKAESVLAGWVAPNVRQYDPIDWKEAEAAYGRLCVAEAASPISIIGEAPLPAAEDGRKVQVELIGDLPGPQVARLRGLLSPEETAKLIDIGRKDLKGSVVFEDGKLVEARYRTSQTNWLGQEDDKDGVLQRLAQRISLITGLSLESAEEFQIAYYTAENQGRYEPHLDWGRDQAVTRDFGSFIDAGGEEQQKGARIATFLMYLNTVEGGGSTTFVSENLTLKAEVGTAIFWYNVRPSGAGDERVRHGACPVLAGEKWIMTKWIHDRGNEAVLEAAGGMPRIARHWSDVLQRLRTLDQQQRSAKTLNDAESWAASQPSLEPRPLVHSLSCAERALASRCDLVPMEMASACPGRCDEKLKELRKVVNDAVPPSLAQRLAELATLAVRAGGLLVNSPVLSAGVTPTEAASWAVASQEPKAKIWAEDFLSAVESVGRSVASSFGLNPPGSSAPGGLHYDYIQLVCRTSPSIAFGSSKTFFTQHQGYIPAGGDLETAVMTVMEAKARCEELPACEGFTFNGKAGSGAVTVYFKERWGLQGKGWTSYRRESQPAAGTDALAEHADNCFAEGRSCVRAPPRYHWRSHSAVLFLHSPASGDFEGGSFYFSPSWRSRESRQRIEPQPGRLVTFTAGPENIHGVEEVTNGTRCSLNVWLTRDSYRASARHEIEDALIILKEHAGHS
eukprot:CAMPEP_0197635686 /NCGR_PEP_ID=MMETSP1338-20131121/11433_1 /TAXON_ID=43686 ORGANISM="Pelagodinium beii, Strain RCC1491" /NCGR_SAMPLE_ID=MMETSP1338 /ASSEMBLY_ACC=CAM_ASM_000754 /LENGTH=1032 /DNA_ID=CAMNT_0043207799 /DNA_START=12 /DNA_END=3110 /DNA_ORIENTATION=+